MRGLLFAPIKGGREIFLSVDLLRGLSALVILLFHFPHFSMGGPGMELSPIALENVPILRLLSPIMEDGGLAVMLFWLISGFVFMNIYAGARPAGWTFFVNRLSRLYPLHLLTLIVIALLQYLSVTTFGHYMIYQWNDAYHFLLQLFFASEWGLQQGRSFNGPIWSVSVEVLIYGIFYLYVRFLDVSLASLTAVLIAFVCLVYKFPASQIASCGVFFFGGAGVYAVYAFLPMGWRRPAGLAALGGAIALAVMGITHGTGPVPLTLWLLGTFGLAILALAISEFTLLRHGYRRLRYLGDLTYSSYLWHSPLQMLFLLGVGFGFWRIDIVPTNGFVIGYVVVVLIVSYFSFAYIERPAQQGLRRALLVSRSPKKLVAAP